MDIRERLRLLETLPTAKPPENSSTVAGIPRADAAEVLSGEAISTPFGGFLRIKNQYPSDARHGPSKLTSFLNISPHWFALLAAQKELSGIDLSRTLFIDTETTGLSGGVGTCAFLVGIGYFTAGTFVIEQFFMRDLDEERALFHNLTTLLLDFDLLVSYNGKSYDIPLLNSRHIYQGLRARFDDMHHLDLLHCVRRLWKHRFTDCKLTTVEEMLINSARKDDIPGFLIPYTYFEYLRTRNATPLEPIFEHNRLDILTMVLILTKATEILDNPLTQCQDAVEILQVGRVYESAGNLPEANRLYEEYLNNGPPEQRTREVLFSLGFNYKKLKDWKNAAKIWETCIATQRFHPLPHIELAKYEEHRGKRLERAKEIVDNALRQIEIIDSLGSHQDWLEFKEDLEYRKARIGRKLARNNPAQAAHETG